MNESEVHRWINTLSPRGWTLFAATVFGIGGLLTVFIVSIVVFGAVSWTFEIALILGVVFARNAGVLGFVVGGVHWCFLVEIPRTYSNGRGILAGASTGLLSHYVMPLYVYLETWGIPGTYGTQLELIDYVASSGTTTVIYSGVFTVSAGAYIGWKLARVRRSSIEHSLSAGGDRTESE
jgi:hypothetical protein